MCWSAQPPQRAKCGQGGGTMRSWLGDQDVHRQRPGPAPAGTASTLLTRQGAGHVERAALWRRGDPVAIGAEALYVQGQRRPR